MDIEMIEDQQPLPLKVLITFINDNIYSKMDKKAVAEIKSKGLGGSLLCAIDKYYRNQKAIDNDKLIKDYEFQLKNTQSIIEGLRNGKADSKGYGEGRYQGD